MLSKEQLHDKSSFSCTVTKPWSGKDQVLIHPFSNCVESSSSHKVESTPSHTNRKELIQTINNSEFIRGTEAELTSFRLTKLSNSEVRVSPTNRNTVQILDSQIIEESPASEKNSEDEVIFNHGAKT